MDKELHTPKMDIGFCQLFVNIIRYLMILQNWEPMLKDSEGAANLMWKKS